MVKKEDRVLSYDIIRILAIFMVTLIHATGYFIVLIPPEDKNFLYGTVIDSIARPSVPLFLMVSGALMLDESKKISNRTIIKKALNTLIVLMVWSLLYAVTYELVIPIFRSNSISVHAFIHAVFTGHYHLWFLYVIIGLYLLSPIFRLLVKEENKKYILYFIFLSVVFQVSVPTLNMFSNLFIGNNDYYQSLMDGFAMDAVSPYISYFFIGWYLSNHRLTRKARYAIYIAGIAGCIGSILGLLYFSAQQGKLIDVFWENTNLPVFLFSVAIFEWITVKFRGKRIENQKLNDVVVNLSRMSFGVYAVHIIILDEIARYVFARKPFYTMPMMWLLVTALSYLVTFAGSKIPVVKKLFRF